MIRLLAILLFTLATGVAAMASDSLPRSTPETQGIPSSAILAFVEAAERDIDALHGFVLVRHGYVVAQGWWKPYGPEIPHQLFSLSKSFTSTAVGLAIEEGLLNLDDPVLSFFPDDAPAEPSDNLKGMRIRQLLSMSTGHGEDTTGSLFEREDGNWIAAFLAQPVSHKPGTHFLYNSGATFMLSAIVQKVTGMTVLDYLRPRLFEPLGIENPTWETNPQGIDVGDQEQPYAASGAWISEDTYVVKLCFYATPFRPTLTFQFGGNLVVYDFEYNVSFGPPRRPQLVGRAD